MWGPHVGCLSRQPPIRQRRERERERLGEEKEKKKNPKSKAARERNPSGEEGGDGGGEPEEEQREAAAGGEPGAVRAEPAVQHLERGDVRHLRQVRRDPADPAGERQGHPGHGLRRLRGHLRRQERRRPPLRLQRRQPLPHRALLPAGQDVQEVGRQEEGGGDHQAAGEVWPRLQDAFIRPRRVGFSSEISSSASTCIKNRELLIQSCSLCSWAVCAIVSYQ